MRSVCRFSDHDVVMRPRRTMCSPLTSKMSAKSARIAISRLKRTGFWLLLVMSMSSCSPPSIWRPIIRPRVRAAIGPSSLTKARLVWKMRAA